MNFGGKCGRDRHGGFHRFPGMQGFMRQHGHGHHGCGKMFQSMGSEGNSNSTNVDGFGATSQEPTGEQKAKTVDEIAKSLEEMGIKADGGVIRDLIEQFHGDIRKIIEAMH